MKEHIAFVIAVENNIEFRVIEFAAEGLDSVRRLIPGNGTAVVTYQPPSPVSIRLELPLRATREAYARILEDAARALREKR